GWAVSGGGVPVLGFGRGADPRQPCNARQLRRHSLGRGGNRPRCGRASVVRVSGSRGGGVLHHRPAAVGPFGPGGCGGAGRGGGYGALVGRGADSLAPPPGGGTAPPRAP